ncbi:MAG TPA: hypothetical protein VMH78_05660 [Thermoplasmata archaeon]|nr:hypothetical protein [Thermoplasmata archaeon]
MYLSVRLKRTGPGCRRAVQLGRRPTPATPDGTTSNAVAAQSGPIALPRRSPTPLAPLTPEFLLGYFDLALAATFDFPRYQGVYVSPWWDLSDPETTEARVWKRAVLRRIPSAGATHWGHLYLVVSDGPFAPRISRAGWGMPQGPEPIEPREILLRLGLPRVALWTRPSHPDRSPELDGFAELVAERFRRQLD